MAETNGGAGPAVTARKKGVNLNKELAKELTENVRKKFHILNLSEKDICRITNIALLTMAGNLRRRTNFNGARFLEYAAKFVQDSMREKNGAE